MQQLHPIEAGGCGLDEPRVERERVWHPGIAGIRVVLHDQQATPGPEGGANPGQYAPSIGDEVEAVGREDPVEWAKRNRIREVEDVCLDVRLGEPHPDAHINPNHGPRVPVRREDIGAFPKDIGQGQGESAAAGPEFQPSRACALDTGADERDVIIMIHRRMIAG